MAGWSDQTDPWIVARRATGRRRWLRRRLLRMLVRRRRIAWLIAQGALEHHGAQAEMARLAGVSRATVCRDVAAILAEARGW